MPKIIEADKVKRIQLLTGYFIGLLVFIILSLVLYLFFKDLYNKLHLKDIIILSNLFFICILSLFLIPSLYLIRTGVIIFKEKSFPYKGMILIRNTELKTGKNAEKIGKRLVAIGVIATVVIISSIIMTNRLNKEFLDDPFSTLNRKMPEFILNLFLKSNNHIQKQ